MDSAVVLSHDEGPVRVITINRPKQLNALNNQVIEQLDQQVSAIEAGCDVRVLILTGAGDRAFVAGADIKELQALNALEAADLSGRVQSLFQRLRDLPIPVIAAVNGFALGGGLELALACDFIYAAQTAVLGLVETDLGLIPGYAGVSRLADRIGTSQAREALFTARKFSAEESLTLGLTNRVIPAEELMPETIQVAESIAKKSRGSLRSLKELLGIIEGPNQANRVLEQQAFGLTFTDPDAKEGIQAFVEKRKPNFQS